MGVDYSATTGYGFAIPEEEIEPLAEKLGFEESEWGFDVWEFGHWLTRDNSLAYEHVGNLMGGEDIYLLILASATAHAVDHHYDYDAGITKLGEIEVTERDKRELVEVYDRLYGQGAHKDAYIGWILAMTVS